MIVSRIGQVVTSRGSFDSFRLVFSNAASYACHVYMSPWELRWHADYSRWDVYIHRFVERYLLWQRFYRNRTHSRGKARERVKISSGSIPHVWSKTRYAYFFYFYSWPYFFSTGGMFFQRVKLVSPRREEDVSEHPLTQRPYFSSVIFCRKWYNE